MRRMRTGRDAAPAGSASSVEPPGASGDTVRPNYVGPSGQPGWWGRMNAGESPRNQGRSVCRPPLSVSRRRSRGLRKTPQWGAERRAGTRYGPAIPFRKRDWFDRKANQRSRRSAAANFGAPLPSDGDAKGSKPTIWHDSPPGCAARQRSPSAQTNSKRKDDAETCAPNTPPSFRGAPKARARNPEERNCLRFWIPGSPPQRVADARKRADGGALE